MQFESKSTHNVIAKDEILEQSELTPSPFPLPCGERIEERGKRKFLYNQDKFKTIFAISKRDCAVYPKRCKRDCSTLFVMTKLEYFRVLRVEGVNWWK